MDSHRFKEDLIRFHVVANSDSETDQSVKFQVRDAVLNSIRNDLTLITDIDSARTYLRGNLHKIQKIANDTLKLTGMEARATVSLCRQAFDTSVYDTFSLPAGVYESLKIVIGNGEGKNWWCVAFPMLCMPATVTEFEETAVSAGFSEVLARSLSGYPLYQIRFFTMDAIGKLESFCFNG